MGVAVVFYPDDENRVFLTNSYLRVERRTECPLVSIGALPAALIGKPLMDEPRNKQRFAPRVAWCYR